VKQQQTMILGINESDSHPLTRNPRVASDPIHYPVYNHLYVL